MRVSSVRPEKQDTIKPWFNVSHLILPPFGEDTQQSTILLNKTKILNISKDTRHHNTRNGELYTLLAHHLKLSETKPSYIGRKL
jgi:hypothetical protein